MKTLEAGLCATVYERPGGASPPPFTSHPMSRKAGGLMGRPAKMMASRLKASGLALPGEGSRSRGSSGGGS